MSRWPCHVKAVIGRGPSVLFNCGASLCGRDAFEVPPIVVTIDDHEPRLSAILALPQFGGVRAASGPSELCVEWDVISRARADAQREPLAITHQNAIAPAVEVTN